MRLRRDAIEARALARVDRPAGPPDPDPLEDVRQAVQLLPRAQRDTILLHYIEGLSCDEIAEMLDSTPGAVRVRLHRARGELRSRLASPPNEMRDVQVRFFTRRDAVAGLR